LLFGANLNTGDKDHATLRFAYRPVTFDHDADASRINLPLKEEY